MNHQPTFSDPPPNAQALKATIRGAVLDWTSAPFQPTALELLTKLEQKFGWYVRHLFAEVICELRSDPSVKSYLREYFKATLTDDGIRSPSR